ncbi:MAG: alpha/beta hydrolase [Myxococcaceae bacterium]|jgi:predicted alpha/beta superfamily hydrolase|nr:alpha/beta hydrolase [Myxococcaceae bacterium]MCA3016108.1 alpha/beta hydrolase [Myxococcaceae bacterium]
MRRAMSSTLVLLALLACGPRPGALDAVGAANVPVSAGGGGAAFTGVDGGPGDAGSVDGGGGGAGDAGARQTTVLVHYPTGARRMFLRGAQAPLSWSAGVEMRPVDADTWSYTLPAGAEPLEFKPRLDDQAWAKGPNFVAQPGDTVEVYPRFFRDVGEVRRAFSDFRSTLLGNTRVVWVYLPPTYLENTSARAPVVYLHDGQNLFDARTAFGGTEWQVDETMNRAASDGTIAEAIVVGPENAGSARLDEYTPTSTAMYGGGRGALYLRFLVEELKPIIDRDFRTRPGRAFTAIMGSSLGGLSSTFAGVTRPETFGLVGALSPSTWWDGRWILGSVAGLRPTPDRPLKVYVDSGNAGASMDDVANTAQLAQAFRDRGYADEVTLKYVVQSGATHSERHWAERLPGALRFLLGPGR